MNLKRTFTYGILQVDVVKIFVLFWHSSTIKVPLDIHTKEERNYIGMSVS